MPRSARTAAIVVLATTSCATNTTTSAGKESATMQQGQSAAEERPVDIAHRWRLADLYATDAAWKKAIESFAVRVERLAEHKGRLAAGAASLADGLDALYGLDRELNRLYSYASKRSDEDTRDADALEMKQRAHRLATEFSQLASFFEPEILSLGADKVKAFAASEPRLEVYAHFLDDTLRRKPHTLDAAGEEIVAATGLMSDTASSLYSIFTNSDLPFPSIKLSDGTEVRLDQSAYTLHRSATNRPDRKAVFEAFWGKWAEFEQTVGVALYSQLKKDVFYKQVRSYPTCLARALDSNNVPEAVYRKLIEVTNNNLATLHRYFKLRAHMLGVDDLGYHDIYPPLVQTDLSFPIEFGQRMAVESLAPLGDSYVQTVQKGFQDRWMDTYPRRGKRSGAYSSGAAYDVHPYVLMNYNDDYESVSTLVHEWGHTMHSYLANGAQPYPTAHYSIFIAEVASTFNEALLLEHALRTAKSDQERLYYLGFALEGLRGTFFRQTMFAEFELRIHELVEAGEALSGKRFTELYGEILKRYHGHDKAVMTIDDAYMVEWAYIPHFYYNFYVYQYATSLAAASLFAQDVIDKKDGAVQRYLAVLKSGGSKYPHDLLKNAGVDLTTAAPYEALFARMNRIMDQIEEILARS